RAPPSRRRAGCTGARSRWRPVVPLPAPSRPLAEGAPRQAADDERRAGVDVRGQAEARRRVPLRHRPPGLSAPCTDGDAPAYGGIRMARRSPGELAATPGWLAGNALRSQGPARGPRSLVL